MVSGKVTLSKCCDDELPFQHYYSLLSHYRKPDKSEIEEPLEPCPYCAHPVPQTKLDCPQCKNNIPYCIVTVRVGNRTCSFSVNSPNHLGSPPWWRMCCGLILICCHVQCPVLNMPLIFVWCSNYIMFTNRQLLHHTTYQQSLRWYLLHFHSWVGIDL